MEMYKATPRVSDRRSLRLMVKSRVESHAIHVDMIDMKVANMHAPVGHVAWVEGRLAGVVFEGKIHEAVLDHLIDAQRPNIRAARGNRRYI